MRKSLAVIIFCCFVSSTGFGEQLYNAPFIDLGPTIKKLLVGQLGVNAGYELVMMNYVSVEAALGYGYYWDNILFSDGVHEFIPGLGARFYLMGTAPSGVWIGLFGQYYANLIMGTWGGFPSLSLRLGYKMLINESGGFFFDPYMGYSVSFLEQVLFATDFGIKIGWAF